jgi:hypothetical protein
MIINNHLIHQVTFYIFIFELSKLYFFYRKDLSCNAFHLINLVTFGKNFSNLFFTAKLF